MSVMTHNHSNRSRQNECGEGREGREEGGAR